MRPLEQTEKGQDQDGCHKDVLVTESQRPGFLCFVSTDSLLISTSAGTSPDTRSGSSDPKQDIHYLRFSRFPLTSVHGTLRKELERLPPPCMDRPTNTPSMYFVQRVTDRSSSYLALTVITIRRSYQGIDTSSPLFWWSIPTTFLIYSVRYIAPNLLCWIHYLERLDVEVIDVFPY